MLTRAGLVPLKELLLQMPIRGDQVGQHEIEVVASNRWTRCSWVAVACWE